MRNLRFKLDNSYYVDDLVSTVMKCKEERVACFVPPPTEPNEKFVFPLTGNREEKREQKKKGKKVLL